METNIKFIRWGLATACAFGLAATLVYPSYVTSPRQAREWTLQQTLHYMRAILNQYNLDLERRPQSLNDLVEAGYIKTIPMDPITKRNDAWVLEWADDPRRPGIINIRSGSNAISSRGNTYHNW